MSGDPRFLKLLDDMRELHIKKSADYGSDDDPLRNIRAGEDFAVPAWVNAAIKANDKMFRIQSFVRNGRLENEPLRDSLLDGAAYFLIALVLYEEMQLDTGQKTL